MYPACTIVDRLRKDERYMPGMGLVTIVRARKEKVCRSKTCQVSIITVGSQYISLVGRLKANKSFFTIPLHYSCLTDYIEDYMAEIEEKQKHTIGRNGYTTGNMPTTKLASLDKTQLRRRRTLLLYLNNRDITSLKRAYGSGKVGRVYVVMQHMAERAAELELFGVEYPFMLTRVTDLKDDTLMNLISRHDSDWWGKFVRSANGAERIRWLIRPNESREPVWYVDNELNSPYIMPIEEVDDGNTSEARLRETMPV